MLNRTRIFFYSLTALCWMFAASNPPDSTQQATTQSPTFTPGLSKPSSDCPDFSLPLVVCVSLVGALLLCVGLLLYYISKLKRKAVLNIRNNDYTIMKVSFLKSFCFFKRFIMLITEIKDNKNLFILLLKFSDWYVSLRFHQQWVWTTSASKSDQCLRE